MTPFAGQDRAPTDSRDWFATSNEQADAFHAAGVAAGARSDDKLGPRPEYSAPYYGAFLLDPEGDMIKATFWDMEMAAEMGEG